MVYLQVSSSALLDLLLYFFHINPVLFFLFFTGNDYTKTFLYKYLLPVLLPGEERPRHEEAVQAAEVQPSQGGEAGQQGQQRGLGDAAPRQRQALQLGAQANAHLKQRQ